MKIFFKSFFLFVIVVSSTFGSEIRYLQRSPKALLMGDAFTAIADDAYTLFYNPAALGNSKLIELSTINPSFSLSNILDDTDRFTDFPETVTGITNKIMNYPIYLHLGAAPGIKFGPFGFSLMGSSSTNFILRNQTYPQLEIDYRLDRGFVVGFAYSWGRGGKYVKVNPFQKKKVASTGHRFSLGVSTKFIDRSSLVGNFSLFGMTLLDTINEGAAEIEDLKTVLGYSRGSGWGVDLGGMYLMSTGRSEFTVGLSILDVGGTDFEKESGVSSIPEQEMIVALGAAFKQNLTVFDYQISLDLHPLTGDLDFTRRTHFGLEVSFPLITAYAGWNAGYVSYGVETNLWLFRLMAGFYGIELGTSFKEQEGKRAIVQLSLLDFAYDM